MRAKEMIAILSNLVNDFGDFKVVIESTGQEVEDICYDKDDLGERLLVS